MAATAAAAISSSFSTSMQSVKCVRSKTWNYYDPIKITSKSMSQFSSISNSLGIESILIAVVSQKCRARRITAAVAQEEAALTAEAETQEVPAAEGEVLTAQVETEEIKEEVSSGGDETPINTKLYFGNLPYLCDSAQLAGIIQDYGSPELVEVLYDRDTGRSRGFAFVTMSTIEDCKAVIENLDGSEYGGRTLRVNFADKPKPKEPLYPETEHKLFVGNLSWSVTSESLTRVFQEYGNVVGARVLYDGDTGRSRGYGFVCFPTRSEMEAALQSLDGVELEGRPMRVSLAQGKRQ